MEHENPMENENPTQYVLTINHDEGIDSPNEFSIVQMVSFSTRHLNYMHPDDIDQDKVLATLSYYEHGSCLWSVGQSVAPDYGGFDTVEYAGVIVWNGEDNEREWWSNLSDDERLSILESTAREYTSWSNGEVYSFILETQATCNCCGHVSDDELIDSCGGFIGYEYFLDEVKAVLAGEGVAAGGLTVRGGAAYGVSANELIDEPKPTNSQVSS